tara:strand:- start:40 stop:297 length:258 start_codon:yes stop_codon:yes gene_type:complete
MKPINTTNMTKKQLAEAIRNHDHFSHMSDDHRVYLQGVEQRRLIELELDALFAKRSDKLKFWNEHAPHAAQYRKEYINQLIQLGD